MFLTYGAAAAAAHVPFRCCAITTQLPMSKATRNWDQLLVESHNATSAMPQAAASGFELVKLSQKWREYQGVKNWEGLLDPLDDQLRQEIIRYGHFVEASYQAFDFDPSSPSYASCRFPKSSFLDRSGLTKFGYRVTKYLRATSGIRLPHWIEKGPSWMGIQSSWIGYVAVCNDKEEIDRLGRRDIVIALRGTTTCLEWLENLRAILTPVVNSGQNTGPC